MEYAGCYYLENDGSLWFAISSCDEFGVVTTQAILISEAALPPIEDTEEAISSEFPLALESETINTLD